MNERASTGAPDDDGNIAACDAERLAEVEAHFAGISFLASLGAELAALAPGACELRLPFRPEFAQQHGFFHGGLIATLADSAAGHAGLTLTGAGQGSITVEFKLNFLAPAQGEALLAKARVVKAGRTLTVSHADVFAIGGGRETLAATALVTYLNLGEPPGRGNGGEREGRRDS